MLQCLYNSRDQPIILCCSVCIIVGTSLLCYAAVFLTFTYYAEEQQLLSDAIYMPVYINNSLHVADNFYNDCFVRIFMNGITVNIMQAMTVLLECIDRLLRFSINK